MDAYSVYRDIQKRTKGQFLIGVVGPVRTGKSTLIRRFLEVLALPYLSEKEQAEVRDALPLSGEGRRSQRWSRNLCRKTPWSCSLGRAIRSGCD